MCEATQHHSLAAMLQHDMLPPPSPQTPRFTSTMCKFRSTDQYMVVFVHVQHYQYTCTMASLTTKYAGMQKQPAGLLFDFPVFGAALPLAQLSNEDKLCLFQFGSSSTTAVASAPTAAASSRVQASSSMCCGGTCLAVGRS